MSAIPVIRGGLQALYPVTFTIHFDTWIQRNQNGSEQRSIRNNCLVKFGIAWGALAQADKDTLKTLVTTAKGQFDATTSLTFAGTTWDNLSLDSDSFEAIESVTTQYDVKLSFSQVISQNLSPGSMGQPFPTLATGAISQLPWAQRKKFQTTTSSLPSGPKYSFAWFGSGLTNFPTDGQMGWQVGGESLADADAAALIAHYIDNYGRFGDFSFTDEDSTAYAKTHYASDDMVVTALEPNRTSISIALETTF